MTLHRPLLSNTLIIFTSIFLINCTPEQSELYYSGKNIKDDADPVIREILKLNPRCRKVSETSEFKYNNRNRHLIEREVPDAVKKRSKASRFVLLLTPLPLTLRSTDNIIVKKSDSLYPDINQYCTKMDLPSITGFWRCEKRESYIVSTIPRSKALNRYSVSTQLSKNYAYILIYIQQRGTYIPSLTDPHNEYNWKWQPTANE